MYHCPCLEKSFLGGKKSQKGVPSQNNRDFCRMQDKKWKNKMDNESGGNHKESPAREVKVVWACGEKRGALRRKEGGGN